MGVAMTDPMRAAADLRLLRALVFSVVCVTLSAAGHTMASGVGIRPWALLAGGTGVLALVAPLAGRERSLVAISGSLLGAELGLHLLFCLGQLQVSPAAAAGPAGSDSLASRLLCSFDQARLSPAALGQIVRASGLDSSSLSAGMPTGTHAMSMGMMLTPAMLAAHCAAAVVMGFLLRRGEAALWRVVRLAARTAGRLAELLPLTAVLAALRALALIATGADAGLQSARRHRTRTGSESPGRVELQHVVIRRGPPVRLPATA